MQVAKFTDLLSKLSGNYFSNSICADMFFKALTTLKKFPLSLSSGKDCKILENFGECCTHKSLTMFEGHTYFWGCHPDKIHATQEHLKFGYK